MPVAHIPTPVTMRAGVAPDRAAVGLPDGFVFLFSFDFNSVVARKNPAGVVEAFRRAFPEPRAGVSLVLKSINGDRHPEALAALTEAIGGRTDIQLRDEFLDADLRDVLVASCDCYVSLHRSEGFGFTLAEAMLLGKPVVGTAYSGTADYLSDATGFVVDHELVPIGPDAEPYPADGQWAEPDLDHAGQLLRQVVDDPEEARAGRARPGVHPCPPLPGGGGPRDGRAAGARGVLGGRDGARPAAVRRGAGRPQRNADADRRDARAGGLGAGPASGPADAQAAAPADPAPACDRRGALVVDREPGGGDRRCHRRPRRAPRPARSPPARQSPVGGPPLGELQALSAFQAGQRRELTDVAAHLRHIAGEVLPAVDLARAAAAEPYMEGEPFSRFDADDAGRVMGFSDADHKAAGDAGYHEFEDVFRGSEEMIRERQQRYVPLLNGYGPVLDAGCGRGEFLDVLAGADIAARGVDLEPELVAYCHGKGHQDVVQGDAVAHLEGLQPGSLGAVVSMQVVEHLPEADLRRMLAAAHRALRPGGRLILETVNPHSARALKAFWVDLTHQHPIFPEVLLQLCRQAGFGEGYAFAPYGEGDWDADRTQAGEYAVVATR